MSTEIASIPNTSVTGAELQVTEFFGGSARGRMLQLTQGLGLSLDTPGFVQLSRQDVEAMIPVLLAWLNKTDPPQSGFAHWDHGFYKEHRNETIPSPFRNR
jgi:hypothetical protein